MKFLTKVMAARVGSSFRLTARTVAVAIDFDAIANLRFRLFANYSTGDFLLFIF